MSAAKAKTKRENQVPAKSGTALTLSAARRRFLRFFPQGFADKKYFDWERGYKWRAHEKWIENLNKKEFQKLLNAGEFLEIASRAVKIESPMNLLFSFEKLALRDAVKAEHGARIFAEGLFDFLYATGKTAAKFDRWCAAIAALPKKQSRVLTHPVVTVFPFLAQPEKHIFLKPNVTRRAAERCGFDLHYEPTPSRQTYGSLLEFAARIKTELADLKPLDMIDAQSFIWVSGSSEYD